MASSKVGANTVTYVYNAMEQRTKKTGPAAVVPTGANYYAYDEQGMLIGEYDANNKVISETVYLGSIPVALLKQTTTGSGTTTAVATTAHYIYADQIDTPRVITRASDNKMVWRWDQADPFGMAAANENPQALGVFNSNQRFPGQLFDKETNLHYNWHRDYDPQLGRYVQSDPIGLSGGINTFGYVGGNPLVYVDENGLQVAPRLPARVVQHNALNDPNSQARREFGSTAFPDPSDAILPGRNDKPWCRIECPSAVECKPEPFGIRRADGCVEVCTAGPFIDAAARTRPTVSVAPHQRSASPSEWQRLIGIVRGR